MKPWEDNALAITTDGRKLALDARLLSPKASDEPASKLNALVANVAALWERTTPTRGTQLIFADLGVHPTPWGFAVYDDIVTKLVQHGVPRHQIACMGDADTDGKKQALFTKVRQGTVRILLGSTQAMGTGTNVQQRLVASHNGDAPWKPAEVEQRDGRIVRQGNTNTEVAIYRYVTQGSFDAFMWQALETKATFIAQILTGDSTVRQAEDIGGQELAYAEVKAIASGNPAVLTLAETDATLRRLHLLHKQHTDTQYLARRRQRDLPQDIARLERRLAALTQDIQTAEAHATAPLTIGMRTCTREQALAPLTERLRTLPTRLFQTHAVPLGLVQGLHFGLVHHPDGTLGVSLEGALKRSTLLARETPGPRAVLNAVDRLLASAAQDRDTTRRDLAIAQGQLRDYTARLGAAFPHIAYLEALTDLRHQLAQALSSTAQADATAPTLADLVARLTALHAAHTLDASPARTAARATTTVAEAITTRIRQHQAPIPPQATNVRLPEAPAPLVLVPVDGSAPRPATPNARRRPTPRPARSAPQQLRLW